MFPRTESKAHPDTITGRPRRGPLFRNGYRRQASGLAAKILRLSRQTRVVTFPPLVRHFEDGSAELSSAAGLLESALLFGSGRYLKQHSKMYF